MVYSKALYALLAMSAPAFGAVHQANLPAGWTRAKTASADTKITLSIALARQNIDQLESKLMALSTPGHEQYGQWMDAEHIEAMFPTADDSAVTNWLRSNGVKHFQRQGSLLNFVTDVATANKLLGADFAYYQHGTTQKLRTTSYSVPEGVEHTIDLISPTNFFGEPKNAGQLIRVERQSHGAGLVDRHWHSDNNIHVDKSCYDVISPICLRQFFSLGDFTPNPDSGARIGYGNFLNETSQYADLAQFEKLFGLPAENFTTTLINGGVNDQSPNAASGEANLDVQMIVALTHPMPVEAFITAGVPPAIPDLIEPTPQSIENEPYLEYYEYLLAQPNSALPQVISNSYGDPEQTVPEDYAKRVCNLIGMMGLRGISILESSGDTGVGAACQANDGSKKPQFTPQFPGTCPYVTAVGGTQGVVPQVAWNASSGGFSNYFRRAWYQESAVGDYLRHHIAPETKRYYEAYTNFEGRGFPDVAAHSLYPWITIVNHGEEVVTGGTSAAGPQFASIIADLNSVRMDAGKPALGFLNPFLYYLGHYAMNDITEGGSKGCQGIDLQSMQPVPGVIPIPYASWNATVGWDPVTGLGTPNFEKLRNMVMTF